jgi:hypothetical protein
MKYLRTYESWHSNKRDLEKAKSFSNYIILRDKSKTKFIYSVLGIDKDVPSDNSIYVTLIYSQNIITGKLKRHTQSKFAVAAHRIKDVVFTSDSLEECRERLKEYEAEYAAEKYNF